MSSTAIRSSSADVAQGSGVKAVRTAIKTKDAEGPEAPMISSSAPLKLTEAPAEASPAPEVTPRCFCQCRAA